MMALRLVIPIVASILYVVIFQKAGFRGAWLAICAAPVVVPALVSGLVKLLFNGIDPPTMMRAFAVLFFVDIPLTLLPLLVLAFKSWPPVAAPNTRSE